MKPPPRRAPGQLLIVEDEEATRHFVCDALEAQGYEVLGAASIREGLATATTRRPEMIILDLGLPDGDGVDFIRELRLRSRTPIIVLSARHNDMDKIEALDLGADDYLVKPFSVFELMARVRASLRRARDVEAEGSGLIAFGECEIDLNQRIVRRRGDRVHLTQVEFNLAAALAKCEGQLVTHRQLLNLVWGAGACSQVHYLRVYMGRLRRKLELDSTRPVHFLTEVGVGYRFVASEAP